MRVQLELKSFHFLTNRRKWKQFWRWHCEHCRHWQKMSNAYKLFDNDYFPQKSVMGMQLRLKGTCVLIPSFLLMLMTLSQYFLSSLEDCAWREHWITLFWVHQLNEGQGEFYFLRRNVMPFPIDTFQVNVIVTFNRSHETTTIHLFQKF